MMHTNHSAAARSTGLAISLLLAIGGCAAGGGSTADDPCGDCGPTVAPPAPEGLGITDAPALEVSMDEPAELSASLDGATLRIRRGMQTTLEVRVDRTGVDGEVAVWAEGLPAGLVADPAVTPGSVPIGRLVIGAIEGAALGGPHPFTVVVSAAGMDPVEVPASVVVAGAPGSLDETFGDGGIAAFELEGIGVNAVAVDTQGRVVVAGRDFPERRPFIERLGADGALDVAYGEAARELAPEHLRSSFGSDIEMVGDEARLVMYAGTEASEHYILALVALGATGEANVAVGGSGIVALGHFHEDDTAMVALAEGEGTTFVRVEDRLFAVRPTQTLPLLLPEGATRSSAMGYQNHTLTFGLYDTESADRVLARMHVAGGMDRRFGDEGLVRVEDPYPFDETMTRDVRLLSDGGGFATVQRGLEGSVHGELVRFTGAGELDESFGDRGRVRLVDGERPEAMMLDAGERPVLFTERGPSFGRGLRRYTESGRIDRTFGRAGEVDFEAFGLPGTRRVAHDEGADRVVACGAAGAGWGCARFWL